MIACSKCLVSWLSYAVIRMICLTTGRARFFEKLRREKFLTMDCVVIEGYRTRAKNSYEKLSFH